MTELVSRRQFSFHPLMAEAKRRMRRRRLIILVLAVLTAAGAVGAAVVFHPSTAVRPQAAGACPVTGGYYAYAVPQNPADPPAADSDASMWGWTPRKHQISVGDRIHENGRLWQVTGIAAMPGVEPIGRPFGISGWPMVGRHISGDTSLTMCGRLVLRPVA